MKILVADDHKIVRDGLRSLIESEPGMEVVAEAGNGREAVQLTLQKRPDLVIMDVDMPDLNGVEATRQILAALPDIKVITLSMYSDKRLVGQMLDAGASGYLVKSCAFDELIRAVKAVFAGQAFLSPSITGVMIKDYVGRMRSTAPELSSPLTAREREVLQLLAEGNTIKEIGSRLHVSVKTVHTHRQRIMEKLGLYSTAELTKYAVREGLTSGL
ncbi:MAG: response regulator [Syntrophobacteria bacterium]